MQAYASTLFRATPDAMKRATAEYLEKGFSAIKFGWGAFGQDAKLDVALVKAARQEAGPDVTLMVDAGWYNADLNNPYRQRTRKEWRLVAADLEEFSPFWIEDCCHPENYEAYADLSEGTSIRIAAGEQEATVKGFERLMTCGKVDVVQPDLSRCGGLSVGRKIADMAKSYGVDCCCHAWLTDLLKAASLHLGAYQQKALFLEYNVSSSSLLNQVCTEPILMRNGRIAIPDGPGLGVEVNEDALVPFRVH